MNPNTGSSISYVLGAKADGIVANVVFTFLFAPVPATTSTHIVTQFSVRVIAPVFTDQPLAPLHVSAVRDTEYYFSFPMTVSCTYISVLDIDVADEK